MVILARSAADGLELRASSYPSLQADLRFASPILELEFQKEEADRSRAAARTPQFHLNRAGIWGVVLLRALASGELGAAALVLVVLVMPAVTASLPQGAYRRWRSPLKAFDNLLQILMGCRTHHLLYPNPASGAPSYFQAAAVLLTGNGVLWQLFNSIWGSIPFRYAVPQQAMLTIVLLLFNRTLCSSNLAIQHAYEAMQRGPSLAARWLWAPLAALQAGPAGLSSCQAERSCAAATLAGSAVAHGPANASLPGAAAGVAGFPSAAAPVVHDGAQLCMSLQPVSQLLLGFVLPTFIIWSAELRSRRAFLAARHSDGAAGGAHAELAGAALRHLPGLVDYLMFAVPGVLCMWSMVALHA